MKHALQLCLTYSEGAFNKDVLTGVKQLDDKGAEVSYQKFDYYDDVQAAKGYVPLRKNRKHGIRTMTALTQWGL